MRIAILAYDRISPFMLSTPLAVFGEPFLASGHQVAVCSAERRLSANGGLTVEAPFRLEAAGNADIVILPGWRDADEPVCPEVVATLHEAGERGAIVVGLCFGAFGLAAAGLLDGLRATTHWARVEAFAERYPSVTVDANAIFVDEGRFLTSAGIASGLDCCLHLLSRISGAGETNRVARHLVLAPQRTGAQAQLIERPTVASSVDGRATTVLQDLWTDPTGAPSLDAVAAAAGMSRRSLTRHIRARTGGSLGDWLRRARLARAQDLLASGAQGLEDVSARSGFANAQALRQAFRSELGMTPTQWAALQRY